MTIIRYGSAHEHLFPHESGICHLNHETDGRWFCDDHKVSHHGAKGADFLTEGYDSGRLLHFDAENFD